MAYCVVDRVKRCTACICHQNIGEELLSNMTTCFGMLTRESKGATKLYMEVFYR